VSSHKLVNTSTIIIVLNMFIQYTNTHNYVVFMRRFTVLVMWTVGNVYFPFLDDYNRVVLQAVPGDTSSNYINASYVDVGSSKWYPANRCMSTHCILHCEQLQCMTNLKRISNDVSRFRLCRSVYVLTL
jgi:hypothetical protein